MTPFKQSPGVRPASPPPRHPARTPSQCGGRGGEGSPTLSGGWRGREARGCSACVWTALLRGRREAKGAQRPPPLVRDRGVLGVMGAHGGGGSAGTSSGAGDGRSGPTSRRRNRDRAARPSGRGGLHCRVAAHGRATDGWTQFLGQGAERPPGLCLQGAPSARRGPRWSAPLEGRARPRREGELTLSSTAPPGAPPGRAETLGGSLGTRRTRGQEAPP